jgi:hypothetical protein
MQICRFVGFRARKHSPAPEGSFSTLGSLAANPACVGPWPVSHRSLFVGPRSRTLTWPRSGPASFPYFCPNGFLVTAQGSAQAAFGARDPQLQNNIQGILGFGAGVYQVSMQYPELLVEVLVGEPNLNPRLDFSSTFRGQSETGLRSSPHSKCEH